MSANDEGAAAEQWPVLRTGAGTAAGPDEPAVGAARQGVPTARVAPALREAEARPDRPRAQHLLPPAVELEVVVGRVLLAGRAQDRPGVGWLACGGRVE